MLAEVARGGLSLERSERGIRLELSAQEHTWVRLIDGSGRSLYSRSMWLSAGIHEWDLPQLRPGSYVAQVRAGRQSESLPLMVK